VQLANPAAFWAFELRTTGHVLSVLTYNTNFWVINARLYLELPYLLKFFAMVDASHGTYIYRWGDAPLTYLALAISAKSETLAWMPRSWGYKHWE
jgi:hypothetical protein